MKTIFKIILINVCLLSTNFLYVDSSKAFMTFDEKIKRASKDFKEFFKDLRKQNVIPRDFKLESDNLAYKSQMLYLMFEAIKKSSKLAPEHNLYIRALCEKIEKLNYLELRKFIGELPIDGVTNSKEIMTLTELDKNKILVTLHELYKFKDPGSTIQFTIYPFRSMIRDIYIYISYMNNSSELNISYENKRATLALFLDKILQQILKVKSTYSGCTVKTDDVSLLINTLKSYSIAKPFLKKLILKITLTLIVVIVCLYLAKPALIYGVKVGEAFVSHVFANLINLLHEADVHVARFQLLYNRVGNNIKPYPWE